MMITILQLLVGGLVTMGGTLFAIFATSPPGTVLGLMHLAIGVVSLAAGFALLIKKAPSKGFLFAINGLTIAYSILSEGVVQIESLLPPGATTGSLVGTTTAIVMSGAIIYILSKKRPK